MKHIDLAEWTISSQRVASSSYISQDKTRIAKFAFPNEGQLEPLQEEFRKSNAIHALGISTPRAYDLVETSNGLIGIEYENIVGKESIARSISKRPAEYAQYLDEYARVMNDVHATPCNTQDFPCVTDDVKAAAQHIPFFTSFHKERIAAFLDALPHTTTCLHGDAHLGNIITTPAASYVIDIDAFTYGDPRFDESIMYYFLLLLEDEGLENVMHFSRETAHTCWDYWCREIKGITSEATQAAYEESLRPFAFCMFIRHALDKPKALENVKGFMSGCGLFN